MAESIRFRRLRAEVRMEGPGTSHHVHVDGDAVRDDLPGGHEKIRRAVDSEDGRMRTRSDAGDLRREEPLWPPAALGEPADGVELQEVRERRGHVVVHDAAGQ